MTEQASQAWAFYREVAKNRVVWTIRDDRKGETRFLREMREAGNVKVKFTYWKETDGRYLGYLNSYPDHWTQGEDLQDLKEHLRDLYETFSSEEIPGIKKEEELEVA